MFLLYAGIYLPGYMTSVVGIETSYGMDGCVSIPGKGNLLLFSTTSKVAQGFTQPHIE
jgi:hypothetical protein